MKIDSLREQVNDIKIENTMLKNLIETREQNETTRFHKYNTANTESVACEYPNCIQFVIYYISSWPESKLYTIKCGALYQEYLAWCKANNGETLGNRSLGKSFKKSEL